MSVDDDRYVAYTADGRPVTKAERLADVLAAALDAVLAEQHPDEATVVYLRDAVAILLPG